MVTEQFIGMQHINDKKKVYYLFLLFLLVFGSTSNVLALSLSDVTPKEQVIVEKDAILSIYDPTADFTINNDLTFFRVAINDTRIWFTKSYHYKYYTWFMLWVNEPDGCTFTIDSWFNTANSTATLHLTSPVDGTDVEFAVWSWNFIGTPKATGVLSQSYNADNVTLSMVANSDVDTTIVIYASYGETLYNEWTPENIGFEITDMEGCGNWVFSRTKYYTFRTTVWDGDGWEDIDTVKLNFTDGVNEIVVAYDHREDTFYVESGGDAVSIGDGTLTVIDLNTLQVDFPIYFKDTIFDAQDVDIYMWSNDTSSESGWDLIEEDYFHIYNIGGWSETFTTTGDADRITGGDVFDFYAHNGSTVESDVIYRNLQHIKIVPSVYWTLKAPVFTGFEFGYHFDYCTDDTDEWITGFGVTISPTYVAINTTYRYSTWNVSLYSKGEIVATDIIYVYNRYDTSSLPGTGETQFFIDLWFNKVNASSTCGVRVNAYEYAMEKDTGKDWLIEAVTGADWHPWENMRKELMLFTTLLDENNETLHAGEIKLVRVLSTLEVFTSGADPQYVELRDYKHWDLTFDPETPFEGVQTPPMDDTKVAYIYGGGLLGSLWSALQGLWTDVFGPALLGLFDIFLWFVETIFNMVGDFFGVENLGTAIRDILAELPVFFANALITLIQFLTIIFDILIGSVTPITSIFLILAGWITSIFQVITLTIVWLTTAVVDSGLSELFGSVLLLIGFMLPFWELVRMEQKGFGILFQDLNMIMDVATYVVTVVHQVLTFFVNLVFQLIEMIPVAE